MGRVIRIREVFLFMELDIDWRIVGRLKFFWDYRNVFSIKFIRSDGGFFDT